MVIMVWEILLVVMVAVIAFSIFLAFLYALIELVLTGVAEFIEWLGRKVGSHKI